MSARSGAAAGCRSSAGVIAAGIDRTCLFLRPPGCRGGDAWRYV